jgi:Tfp pilus assembly protein PilF
LMLENRLYLPAVGLALFVAELARATRPRVAGAVGGAVLAASALLMLRYQGDFRDPGAFTAAAVAGAPHSSLAHLQRGIWLQRAQGDLAGAAEQYQAAIALDPGETMAHNDLAVVLMAQQRWIEAESALRAELAAHPGLAIAHYNLGLALRSQGRFDEAARAWEEALVHQPDHLDAIGELFADARRRGDEARARRFADQLSKLGVRLLPVP